MTWAFNRSLRLLLVALSTSLSAGSSAFALGQPDAPDSAAPLRVICDVGYDHKLCAEQVVVLGRVLAKYPVDRLGSWTWVLVPSRDWHRMLENHRLDPDIPAITNIARHETFFDEALFEPVSTRGNRLSQTWTMSVSELLDLAVAHEFAHSICQDFDELRTVDRTRTLQHGGALACPAISDEPVQLALKGRHH